MSELSRQMNEVIRTGRYRGGRSGCLIDRLPGTDMTGGRRERLSAAEVRFEAAVKAGDDVARDTADAEIDAIIDEGRAARRAAELRAEPSISFDGGVQKRVHVPASVERAREMDMMNNPRALFRMAMRASTRQRIERETGL